MTRGRWLLIVALGLVLGLVAVLLSRTRLELAGLEEGRLEVETKLPLLTCHKTLSGTFPFVKVTCEDAESQNTEPADAAP